MPLTKPKKKSVVPKLRLPTVKTVIAQEPKDYIMLFYGPPGVGKTTFVNDLADRVLFLSSDRGTRELKTLRVECSTWKDYERALRALEAPDAPTYPIIAIDHVSDWADAAELSVCEELGIDSLADAGYGKGWTAYKRKLAKFLGRLKALNTGIVFIAHETIKTVKTRSIELDRTMPDMGKSAWKVIVPILALVGFCGYDRVKPKGEKKSIEVRRLFTEPREDLYAKDRTLRTKVGGPEPLKGAKFMATFQKGA